MTTCSITYQVNKLRACSSQIDILDLSISGFIAEHFLKFIEECVYAIQQFQTKVC